MLIQRFEYILIYFVKIQRFEYNDVTILHWPDWNYVGRAKPSWPF